VDVDFGTDVLTLSNLVDEELQILLCWAEYDDK
jgi:hypothetical protein